MTGPRHPVHRGASAGVPVRGSLTARLIAKRLDLRGTRSKLVPHEFRLLEVLVRNAGRVIWKHQLLEQVWGGDTKACANTVEVYVHYLRSKIDRDADHPLIRTVRGVGYMLRV